jgi:HAD superfamily hydrolase (TIGR01509 family)
MHITQINNNVNEVNAVIFDMDGVIFDSESVWKTGFELANQKFKRSFTEQDRQSLCGMDEKSIREMLKSKYPDLCVDDYRDFILNYVNDTINTKGASLKDGFCELVQFLKNNNYKVALATSSSRKRASMLFAKQYLDENSLFDAMVFADEITVSKPDPQIFLLAAKKLNIEPEHCVVLEDSPNGIYAAESGGFKAIMVKDLISPTKELKCKCILVADCLNDVQQYFIGGGKG